MIDEENETDLDRERIDDALAGAKALADRLALQSELDRTGGIVCGSMTLRDFFAAVWMWGQIGSPQETSASAYAHADAMLNRRKGAANA